MKKKDIYIFLICLLISFLPGIIGSLFTTPVIQQGWYQGLKKPILTPPNYVFAPVWTIIYVILAFVLYFLIKKAGKLVYIKVALILFGLQLILNGLWSYIFFGLKSPFGALFVIILLWFLIILCIREFKIISSRAYWLLIPYFLWITYAGYLNIAIYLLNK
jgi:tryptophan-rich sensory protein